MPWKFLFPALLLIPLFTQAAFPNQKFTKQPTIYGNASTGSSFGMLASAEQEPLVEEQPVGTLEPESESKLEDWPEPGPEWEKAYETWGVAWEFHIYTFGVCFFFIFAYALYFVVINIAEGLQGKYLSVSLNIMMITCGISRALVLFMDPYHQGTFVDTPIKFMRILWSLTDPSLAAADSLCILSLLDTYKVSIAPQRFQKPSAIIPVICVHFFLVLISDLVVSEFVEAKAMLLFCQVFFITWCGLLGICYFLIGYKLDQLLFKPGLADQVAQEGRWYICLIYASGLSNLVTSAVYIYSAAGVFGVYSDVMFIEPWPWWSLQTSLRVTELIAAVLVFTVSAKRVQPATQEQQISEPRKRKMSMFSGMRSVRDKTYLEHKQQNVANRNLNMSENWEQCMVGKITESVENVVASSEYELERKDSMFTALGAKAEAARNTLL